MLYLLIIAYCTLAFGIHGGETFKGTNRQVRNLLCAIPFGLICYFTFGWLIALVCLGLAYGGVSLAFNSSILPNGRPTTIWLMAKGMVTCPFGGVLALPLAYYIGYRTSSKNVFAEYFSGTLYGIILAMVLYA